MNQNVVQFKDKDQSENECGPEIALTNSTIKRMFNLANIGKNDIFYDLGSGNGNIVRKAVKEKHVKKAHGIEYDILRFLCAVEDTKLLLNKKDLQKVEFWRAKFEKFDFADATIVYNGLSEDRTEVKMYENIFKNKKGVKIIKLDFPLVGYKPVKVNRKDPKNPLFLMETPLGDYKVDKEEWIQHALGKKGKTIKDVYAHYVKLLAHLEPSDRVSFLKDLTKLIEIRF